MTNIVRSDSTVQSTLDEIYQPQEDYAVHYYYAIALIFELPIGTELTLEYDGSQKCFVDSETGEKLIF